MHPNQQYSAASLMGFQMSMLHLGAALEQSAPIGSKELAIGALAEVELRNLIESHER